MSPHKVASQSNVEEARPAEECALRRCCLRRSDLVDLGEVVRQELLDAALLLRLLLQRIQARQQQISHRVGGALQRQHAMRDKDWMVVQRFVPALSIVLPAFIKVSASRPLIYASLLCAQDGLSTINYLQFGEDV